MPTRAKGNEAAGKIGVRKIAYHLAEFGVLDHHSMYDTQKGFIAREQTSPASEGVSL